MVSFKSHSKTKTLVKIFLAERVDRPVHFLFLVSTASLKEKSTE